MLASEIGTSHFQAMVCSWSSRKRGKVQRNQIMTKDQDADLGEENARPEDVEHPLAQARGPVAAEEESGGDGREREHVGELGQEEEEKAKAAVLGDVSHHQFGLRDRHVEGNSRELSQRGDHEHGEADELHDDKGHPQAPAVLGEPGRLGIDDAGQRHRPGHDYRADDGEDERQFVGDELARPHAGRRSTNTCWLTTIPP